MKKSRVSPESQRSVMGGGGGGGGGGGTFGGGGGVGTAKKKDKNGERVIVSADSDSKNEIWKLIRGNRILVHGNWHVSRFRRRGGEGGGDNICRTVKERLNTAESCKRQGMGGMGLA